jgi:phosphatidylglycerophosphatase A
LVPKAPGTFGTLAGFAVYWLLTWLPAPAFWPALLALFLLGIWICSVTGRALGVADHGAMVWDEIVAFALVLAFAPPTLAWWVAAFALFRLFDIWKPFPIRYFDRTVKGGFGVMFDDLLAAGYAVNPAHRTEIARLGACRSCACVAAPKAPMQGARRDLAVQ